MNGEKIIEVVQHYGVNNLMADMSIKWQMEIIKEKMTSLMKNRILCVWPEV